jgi:beta-lactamase regulating signal transducer with metallopeptidase domain
MEAFNMHLLRVFDWLLWTTIQGSVLIVLIVLLQIILRQRLPVRWHYLLWVLLLIRLAVPWLPESKLSIFNLVPRSIQQGRIIESFSQSRNAEPMDFYMYGRFTSAPQKTDESQTLSVRFVRALPVLWLVGTVLIAGYILMRSIRLWYIVKRERLITDSEILDLLEDCKMQMGIQTIIGIVVSDRIKSPALFGFVRPRLLLPQGMLETYGPEELHYVFIHELAHLKQRDIYFGWLMALLQVVHWFNQLLWFASRRMRADRELSCDTLAISTMGPEELPQYGRTIVSLIERFSQVSYLPSVAGIVEDTCQLERRIKMIADYKKTSRTHWAGAILLFAALACVVLTNAYVAKADFTFDTSINLGPAINNAGWNGAVCIPPDGLELYFGSEDGNIWVARRATVNSEWDPALNLGPVVNSSAIDGGPCISPDGLSLYLDSDRSGGSGSVDIWVTTRTSTEDNWGNPTNLGPSVNSSSWDWGQSISADGLQLYFTSNRPGGSGGQDMYVISRTANDEPWGEPVNLGPTLNSSAGDQFPHVSADGLLLFFGSNRSGGYGSWDLYVARRATTMDPWEPPVNLGPMVNGTAGEDGPKVTTDGSMLYFHSNRPGGFGSWDVWQASILPVVDFNGDGNIDTNDLVILVNYWGSNERLCDIGPTPFGDGIVDMKDLEVFMSYWEQENMPANPGDEQ